jgi:hypothetical protein
MTLTLSFTTTGKVQQGATIETLVSVWNYVAGHFSVLLFKPLLFL